MEWGKIYDSENNQKQLVIFKGFHQIKEDFQALEKFDNDDIKMSASVILKKIYEIEDKHRNFEPPPGYLTVTTTV